MLLLPATATAGHTGDPRTPNIVPLGHIVEPAILGGFGGGDPDIHTDIAFRGRHAFQGNWDGFTIRDISAPGNPRTVSRTFCEGNQGDVVVWGNLLVRSWDPLAGTPGPFGGGLTCDGQPVQTGFEGIHVFDIRNLANPVLVASVPTPCGSHTATGVPDPANNRLLIYNSASTATCPQFDVISIPLNAPQTARLVRSEPAQAQCHDISVILGRTMLAACAGGPGARVFSLGGARGGSLEDPQFLYAIPVPTVTIGHSAAFSWDGNILIFGHEPGGGVAAECEATDAPEKKSFFFYRTSDGTLLGRWTLPRPQTATENCTLHNFNVVPFVDRHVLVHGSYQSGTSVVDFTNPAAARELAWSDPPPRPVPAGSPFCCDVAGVWSSYWYNDVIYETNIAEGLNLFDIREPWWDRGVNLPHLNPQTQDQALRCSVSAGGRALRANQRGQLTVSVRVLGQRTGGLRVALSGAGVTRAATTRENGTVQITVRPQRRGVVRVSVPSTLNMQGCSTSRTVLAAQKRPGGGGGGGAGLTGRGA